MDSTEKRASAGRLFLGVPLPETVREALRGHLRGSFGERLPGRAVVPENWHFTLRFLGDTDAARRDALVDALRSSDLGPAFALGFGAMGAFPRPARASVLWVGVEDGAAEIRALAAVVEEAARRAGFVAEEKAFSPHLTVSRLNPPADVRREIAEVPPFGGRMEVDAVTLFRSHLGGGPPRYEAVERFPLNEKAG